MGKGVLVLTDWVWDLEESAERGLRRTVVMSETKCAALLPSEGRYPIDPSDGGGAWRPAGWCLGGGCFLLFRRMDLTCNFLFIYGKLKSKRSLKNGLN